MLLCTDEHDETIDACYCDEMFAKIVAGGNLWPLPTTMA